MDLQKLVELLIAGGLAGIIGALVVVWKTKRDAEREDRKQKADEKTTTATAADTIAKAATSVVALHDAQVEDLKRQVDEFKLQLRAAQAELSAFDTRLNIEMQNRLRAEARASINEDRIKELDSKLAAMGAQFELADTERQRLGRENGAMKVRIFEMSVGVHSLVQQVTAAGLAPVYVLDVPALDDPQRSTGKLGTLDALTVKRRARSRSWRARGRWPAR